MTVATEQRVKILVIDDDASHAETVAEALERKGYTCTVANSGKQGSAWLDKEDFDLVLTDLRMSEIDGLAIVRKVKKQSPETEVMVITGNGDVKTAVEAIKLGATHYLMKPLDLGELRAIVDKSSEKIHLSWDNRNLRSQLDEKFGFEGVVGSGRKMNDIINRLRALAQTKATVLILGENGTGKELVAKALHNNSPRKNKPFVAMNCAALNENLLDDEMFGHEAHAFTGADKVRKGRFEYANGGTLFLDEVGDMPLTLQAKLLRVLENSEVTRLGSNEIIKVDVRLIAATNRNLETMIKENKFRADLYHRLRVATIILPPLRERKEDIPILAAHFLKEMNQRHGKSITEIADPIRKALAFYNWPGNVRELRNQIETMVIFDTDGILGLDDLQEGDSLSKISVPGEQKNSGADHLIGRPLAEVDRYYKERALELTNGNREDAANLLGIGERTLYRDMQEWKLQDRIKEVMVQTQGNLAEAAKILDMTEDALSRKLKKMGHSNADSTTQEDTNEPVE